MIGDVRVRGLSGGEMKRTSIAVELVTNPKILFIDEPTSGLDSFTAYKIVKLLIDFLDKGKTVVCTIHQPSSKMFKLFPSLLLLMDGHTIYHGPAGESMDYFKKLGFVAPKYSNPADYYLKEFYVPFVRTEKDERKIEYLNDSYDMQIKDRLLIQGEAIDCNELSEQDLYESMIRVSWFFEFWILLKRAFYNVFYQPLIIKYKILGYTVVALFCLSLFWRLGNDPEGVRSKLGAMLFML